jgi:RNA polymerase sigma-70 factor (ECF subfamily)
MEILSNGWANLSQNGGEWRYGCVNAESKAMEAGAAATPFDFEGFFHIHYERIARVIARVVRDTARSEELAVEVFWKLWRKPSAQGGDSGGWLYRTAVRLALDELRRYARRNHYEGLSGHSGRVPTPEEVHSVAEEQRQVRFVLSQMESREASLLILRSEELSYGEIAAALELNPASIGTFVSRAQQAFRKEYVKQYGAQ